MARRRQRKGFGKGSRHSPETRERLRQLALRRSARREAEIRAVPRLATLRRRGIAPELLDRAAEEVLTLAEHLGGVEILGPVRMRVLEDAALLGLVLQREVLEYAKARDPEAAARITSLVNSRRASFRELGFEPLEREAFDLTQGVEVAFGSEDATPGPNGVDRDHQGAGPGDRPGGGNAERADRPQGGA